MKCPSCVNTRAKHSVGDTDMPPGFQDPFPDVLNQSTSVTCSDV